MTSANEIWSQLSDPWRAAFTEAWVSYCEGNLGIGAVLVDPHTGDVVAAGRNRVNSTNELPQTLSGNFMAHAEMNAFAALDRYKADGLDIYTTLQPCLMCAATAVFMHVETVWFASADEYFADISDLWEHHPYSARNKPQERGPLDAPLATFARLLPLSVQAAAHPGGSVIQQAERDIPDIAALAQSREVNTTLAELADMQASVEEALAAFLNFLA